MSDIIFTSSALAKNGREGHVKSTDGMIDLPLANPATDSTKEGSNPEQLFAAGYAACFDGALNLVASNQNMKISSETKAKVSFMKDKEHGGNKIGVTLEINIEGVNPEDANDLAEEAHKICPYSKAIRGNVDVQLEPNAIG